MLKTIPRVIGLALFCFTSQLALSAPTYHQDTKPIIDAHCGICHKAGGIGPFPLQTYSDVVKKAGLVEWAVTENIMPPWMLSEGHNARYDISLPAERKQILLDWLKNGLEEGDSSQPGQAIAMELEPDVVPNVHMDIGEAYLPEIESGKDDYQCFPMIWPEEGESYVTGFDFSATNPEVIHHLVIYTATAEHAKTIEEMDRADPASGYDCLGDATATGSTKLLPTSFLGLGGMHVNRKSLPAGTGIRLSKGTVVIAQAHFSGKSSGEKQLLKFGFQTARAVEHPAVYLPVLNPVWPLIPSTMKIPYGQASVVHEYDSKVIGSVYHWQYAKEFDFSKGFVVHQSVLHMHEHGSSGFVKLNRADGSSEDMLNIPKWNFHWQREYTFKQPYTFHPGDQIKVSCEFNNSAEFNDELGLDPNAKKDVVWGNRSEDEMCASMIYVTAVK